MASGTQTGDSPVPNLKHPPEWTLRPQVLLIQGTVIATAILVDSSLS